MVQTDENVFWGYVTDSKGTPLSDVKIHYLLNFDNITTSTLNKNLSFSSTLIIFTLPFPSHVILQILDWKGRDTVAVIMNEIKNPGSYAVAWNEKDSNGSYSPNGIYKYEIITDSSKVSKQFPLFRDDINELKEVKPFSHSDINGNFSFYYSDSVKTF
ncbi:MAG: hypothetical protein ABI550_02300 [Ignavibacteriaceae bacterium]